MIFPICAAKKYRTSLSGNWLTELIGSFHRPFPSNRGVMLRTLVVLGALAVSGPIALSQGSRNDSGFKVITVGRITKINIAEQCFELRSRIPEPIPTRRPSTGRGLPGPWFGEIHGSIAIGPVRVGIQVGDRPDSIRVDNGSISIGPVRVGVQASDRPDSIRVDTGAPQPRRRYRTSRVSITGETVIRHNGDPITLDQLEVGDNVTVTGIPHGQDMEATEVEKKSVLARRFTVSS